MKRLTGLKSAAVVVLVLGGLGAVNAASAATDIYFSVGVPAAIYGPPQAVYLPGPPAYSYSPPEVVYEPQPVYVVPRYGDEYRWEQRRAWREAQWRRHREWEQRREWREHHRWNGGY